MCKNGFKEVPTLTLHHHAPKLKITKEYWYWAFYLFTVSSTWKTLKLVKSDFRRIDLLRLKKEILICPNHNGEIQLLKNVFKSQQITNRRAHSQRV